MFSPIPITLICAHWWGDWRLQTGWMALEKSKHWKPLTAHVAVVTLLLLPWGWKFALLNGVLHWLTDFFTSRYTSKMWFVKVERAMPCNGEHWCSLKFDNYKRSEFFSMIGLDQVIHYTCYALTLNLF